MALPKLNNAPKYELTVPSTQKKIMFRPFLVKEEKALMIAAESGNSSNVLKTLIDVITSCLEDEVSTNTLTSFDVEYMFLQLRSKSVGETSNIGLKCEECSATNEMVINLDNVKIEIPDVEKNIKLTDNISVEIDWPSFNDILNSGLHDPDNNGSEQAFALVRSCLKAVVTDDERISLKDSTEEEVQEFVDSMSSAQFNKIREFVEMIPKLSHTLRFKCNKCEHDNDVTIEGVANFLS